VRIEVPDPSLVVLVGPAGAGKTTFAMRHFAPDEVLSSDAFRALVAGDEAEQAASGAAFAALHRSLASRLASRRLTVVDATNVSHRARHALLVRARRAEAPAIAIVFDLGIDLVMARNAARPGRVVDGAVVRRQHAALADLLAIGDLAAEGFAAVHRLAGGQAVEAATISRRPTPPR
jgi:protein phosphatase